MAILGLDILNINGNLDFWTSAAAAWDFWATLAIAGLIGWAVGAAYVRTRHRGTHDR